MERLGLEAQWRSLSTCAEKCTLRFNSVPCTRIWHLDPWAWYFWTNIALFNYDLALKYFFSETNYFFLNDCLLLPLLLKSPFNCCCFEHLTLPTGINADVIIIILDVVSTENGSNCGRVSDFSPVLLLSTGGVILPGCSLTSFTRESEWPVGSGTDAAPPRVPADVDKRIIRLLIRPSKRKAFSSALAREVDVGIS